MKYDRNTVIANIKKLQKWDGKAKSKSYVSYDKIAEHLGKNRRTIIDYLNERKNKDMSFEDIVKLCDLFNCDIECLLDPDMSCKTKEATDICKVTGLTEEAVEVLKEANEYKQLDDNLFGDTFPSYQSIFIECINLIINSFHFEDNYHNSNNVDDMANSFYHYEADEKFPIFKIIKYIFNANKMKWIEGHPDFVALEKYYYEAYETIHFATDENGNERWFAPDEFMIIEDIEKALKRDGYSEDEIKRIEWQTGRFLHDYYQIKKHHYYDKMYIQSDFMKFIDSDFVQNNSEYMKKEADR